MSDKLETPAQRQAYLDLCERERQRIKKLELQQRESQTRHRNKFFDEHRQKTQTFESAPQRMQREGLKKRICLAIFFMVAVPCVSGGGRVDVAWDSDMVNVSGFNVYIGPSSGVREQKIPIPLAELVVVPKPAVIGGNLLDPPMYSVFWTTPELSSGTRFSVVSAYNTEFNLESEMSNEISWTIRGISLTRGNALDNQKVIKTYYFTESEDNQNRMFYSLKFEE